MLLVLIGLGAATIMTFAYLSSRDNSAAIGENVARSATARWAALSGIDLTVAVMETHTDWRTEHTDGVLLDKYPLSNAHVTVKLTDIETNAPPQEGSRYFLIDSSATANGVTQTASATAEVVPLEDTDTVSVDLSEFAVFATHRIELQNQSLIARWPVAPLASLRQSIYLGTHATDAFSIFVGTNAAVVDGTVYHRISASSTLVNGGSLTKVGTEYAIPFPKPPLPGADPPDEDVHGVLNMNSAVSLSGVNRYDTITMGTNNGIIYANNAILVVDDEFNLNAYAGMIVDGNVDLIVFGNLNMDNDSYIELSPNATLRMFVKGDITLADAYIGDERDNTSFRDNSGDAQWIHPDRIRIFSIVDEDETTTDWRLLENSVVKGHMYAPNSRLRIRDSSALYGRAAARRVTLANDGALFYDHTLNPGIGYVNPDSGLYDDLGRIREEFRTLARITQDTLNSLSDALDLNILGGGYYSTGDGGLLSTLLSINSDVGASDPTPRIVRVHIVYESFGDDVRRWEQRNRNFAQAEGTN